MHAHYKIVRGVRRCQIEETNADESHAISTGYLTQECKTFMPSPTGTRRWAQARLEEEQTFWLRADRDGFLVPNIQVFQLEMLVRLYAVVWLFSGLGSK